MDNYFENVELNFKYNEVDEEIAESLAEKISLIDSVMNDNKEQAILLLDKINSRYNIKIVVVGELSTNCYIVENNDKCLIVDPGDEFDKIKNVVDKKVVGVLLTHRHFDHIGALYDCLNYYNVELYSFNNLKEGINNIENIEFEVIFNPGHTKDSISFIFGDKMISGDFIFNGTIGRWDIGGNISDMKNSIKKILDININYKIYPGHGECTTLDDERDNLRVYLD